jgi:hypothetical protein
MIVKDPKYNIYSERNFVVQLARSQRTNSSYDFEFYTAEDREHVDGWANHWPVVAVWRVKSLKQPLCINSHPNKE